MKLPEKNYALQCFHYYAVYDSLYKTGFTVGNETELKWIAVKRHLFIQLYKKERSLHLQHTSTFSPLKTALMLRPHFCGLLC